MKYLILTSTVKHLTKKILLKTKGCRVVFPALNKNKKRCFPDGEIYVRLTPKWLKQLKGQNNTVVVLHSGAPKPNEGLIELELILQALKDSQIKKVEIFFAYFPYGMQDRVFEKGEINAAENLIKKLVNYYKVKKIYIVDPHFGGRKWTKQYPIKSISAVPILVNRARKDLRKNFVFLSPDIGGKRRTGIPGTKKERVGSYKIKMRPLSTNLEKKTVVVIDDMIKTGNTLLAFLKTIKKTGAKNVFALVTHGVLSSGISKVKKKYSNLYVTNTIKQKERSVDITELILNSIFKV